MWLSHGYHRPILSDQLDSPDVNNHFLLFKLKVTGEWALSRMYEAEL